MMQLIILKVKFTEWFLEIVEKKAIKLSKGYGEKYIKNDLARFSNIDCKIERSTRRKHRINILQKIYYGIPKKSIFYIRDSAFQKTISILSRRLRENADNYMEIYNMYEKCIYDLSDIIKGSINIPDELYKPTINAVDITMDNFDVISKKTEDIVDQKAYMYAQNMSNDKKFQTLLCNFKIMYADCLSAFLTIKKTNSIVDVLKSMRDRVNNTIARPDSIVEHQIILDINENRSNIINLDI